MQALDGAITDLFDQVNTLAPTVFYKLEAVLKTYIVDNHNGDIVENPCDAPSTNGDICWYPDGTTMMSTPTSSPERSASSSPTPSTKVEELIREQLPSNELPSKVRKDPR
jgi:hypothetical protein